MAKKEIEKVDQEITESVEKDIEQLENDIESKKTVSAPKSDMVFLEIPISETEQDDWWCCINGKSYLIQRGEKVLVPRAVKEVYDNQQRQRLESYRRSQALQKAAAAKKDRLAFD
jgi:hypothetical protein